MVDLAVLSQWFHSVILEVFSILNDSVVLYSIALFCLHTTLKCDNITEYLSIQSLEIENFCFHNANKLIYVMCLSHN